MKLLSIYRMGWKEALEIMQNGGRIAKFSDGHAEVITAQKKVKRWMGIYGVIEDSEGGECVGYLTGRSVELLEEALAANDESEAPSGGDVHGNR